MKPYLIHFWHGIPPGDSLFMRKVNSLCRKRPEDNQYFWDGSLEDFAINWGDKFIYMPPQLTFATKSSNIQYIMGTLCITPYGGWGQRG
jgi:hypothetical protein